MDKLFYVNDEYEIEEIEKIGRCKDTVNECEYIWEVFKAINGFNRIITLLNTDVEIRCFKDYKTAYLYSFMKFCERFKKNKIENDEEIDKIFEKLDKISEDIMDMKVEE